MIYHLFGNKLKRSAGGGRLSCTPTCKVSCASTNQLRLFAQLHLFSCLLHQRRTTTPQTREARAHGIIICVPGLSPSAEERTNSGISTLPVPFWIIMSTRDPYHINQDKHSDPISYMFHSMPDGDALLHHARHHHERRNSRLFIPASQSGIRVIHSRSRPLTEFPTAHGLQTTTHGCPDPSPPLLNCPDHTYTHLKTDLSLRPHTGAFFQGFQGAFTLFTFYHSYLYCTTTISIRRKTFFLFLTLTTGSFMARQGTGT
ncbi:hypothetical protein HD806DRAFT_261587 [Xylariaceae sp. AK1471]|nr:hypothetical protein HD806DRAFT_261587 [Xylariaceae sp. AK1471]